jgi:tRNA U34 2-thiouridine synthase MnmA/TrmU
MTQEELSKTIFPLGELTKEMTRDIAKDIGLATALRPESQEICFVGDEKYVDFIKEFSLNHCSQALSWTWKEELSENIRDRILYHRTEKEA